MKTELRFVERLIPFPGAALRFSKTLQYRTTYSLLDCPGEDLWDKWKDVPTIMDYGHSLEWPTGSATPPEYRAEQEQKNRDARAMLDAVSPAPNIDRLMLLLAHAVKEADGWFDESRGGQIDDDPLMDEARALVNGVSSAPTSGTECERQRKIEFDIMYNEFMVWEKTADAFECVQTSDFKEVWVTAYRAGMKAQRIAQLKVDILLASDSAGGGS